MKTNVNITQAMTVSTETVFSEKKEWWVSRSFAYYDDLRRIVSYLLPEKAKVLDVGCSTGWVLRSLQPQLLQGVGVDHERSMIETARELAQGDQKLSYQIGDFETLQLNQKFDFVIMSEVISDTYDVQNLLENAKKHLEPEGRVFISVHNSYLKPFFALAEVLGLKRKSSAKNWFVKDDVRQIAELSGFEVIKEGARVMLPWRAFGLGRFFNRFLAPLPVFAWTNLYYYFLLRPKSTRSVVELKKVSVIVPARNEEGNIKNAITRMPKLADHVEVIFVEGNSTDQTWEKIQQVQSESHPEWMSIKSYKQTAKGKANAVHKGFENATGDLLMILDADLTVQPEELPRFVQPMRDGTCDFCHGSRLIYPMDKEAMRFLNQLGNKAFSVLFTYLLDQKFKDTLCGTKVFWRKDWERIKAVRDHYFGDFDPFGDFEMLFGAVKLNMKVIQIPVHYKERTYGETNISRFKHGFILLNMCLFAAKKMKFI